MNEIIKTGLKYFDKSIGGIKKGELTCLAGVPGSGKTVLENQIFLGADKNGHRCLYFSLEMYKETVLRQLALQGVTDISSSRIIDDAEYLDSLLEICEKEQKLDLVIIDHTEIIRIEKERLEKFSVDRGLGADCGTDITRMLKWLAKKLNVAVLVTANVSRRCLYQNRMPTLSDLDKILCEHDFDKIIFLYNKDILKNPRDREKSIIELSIGKNRGGKFPDGKLLLDNKSLSVLDYE